MIEEVTMYSAYCDGCNTLYEESQVGFTAHANEETVTNYAQEEGWYFDDETKKCYCPKCHEIDDDDNLIIKSNKPEVATYMECVIFRYCDSNPECVGKCRYDKD